MADTTCANRSVEGVLRGTNFRIRGLGEGADGLVQQFQLRFERKLSRVYDLSDPVFYYIEGASEGTIALSKVVGPKGAPFLSCDCTPRQIELDAGNVACYPDNASVPSYTLKNALPFGLVGQGDANNFLIVFGISYIFNDISTVDAGGGTEG